MIDLVRLRFFVRAADAADAAPRADLSIGIPAHFPFEEWHPEFRRVYEERLAAGHVPVTCELDGRLAHVSWCAVGSLRIDEVGRRWVLPGEEICVYDVATIPTARGRGVYPAVLAWICRDAFLHGRRRVWIYAEDTNTGSVRGILRAGFSPAGTIRAIRVWKRPLCSFGSPSHRSDP